MYPNTLSIHKAVMGLVNTRTGFISLCANSE